MTVLWFVVVPMLAVTAYAVYTWARNRQPTSVEAGVDAFRREMSALSPDAAPIQRRVDPTAPSEDRRPERADGPAAPRATPRRPPDSGPDRAP
jgi:hypothetical protein